MIYSGLDWSGSPGAGHGPWLVLVVVHFDESDLPTLDEKLTAARALLGRPGDYPFKHVEATVDIHRRFYAALQDIPMQAHVHMLDKAAWRRQYGGRGSRGVDCVCDGIITLLMRCPVELTTDQILYLDLPRNEGKIIEHYRTAIRRAMRGAKRGTFRHVKARPDHRRDGAIIQVADMLAGEVNERQGLSGEYLPRLGSRVCLV